MSIKQVGIPWWMPPIDDKNKQEWLGLKLDKPYWLLTSKISNGVLKTLYGLN